MLAGFLGYDQGHRHTEVACAVGAYGDPTVGTELVVVLALEAGAVGSVCDRRGLRVHTDDRPARV
jgi:hypothetical protein